MKALILAAGKGSRLGSLTDTMPKPMIPVAGMPILERIIDGLAAAGINHYVVVTGFLHEKIEEFLAEKFLSGGEYTVVHQENQDGTGSAVGLCEHILSGEPFFMSYGDILVDNHFYSKIVAAFHQDRSFNYMAVNRMDDPTAGCAVYCRDSLVENLVEKPPPGTSGTPYNNAGIFILQRGIFNALKNVSYSSRGEIEFTDALQEMVRRKLLKHVEIQGFWSDAGTVEWLEKASGYFETGTRE